MQTMRTTTCPYSLAQHCCLTKDTEDVFPVHGIFWRHNYNNLWPLVHICKGNLINCKLVTITPKVICCRSKIKQTLSIITKNALMNLNTQDRPKVGLAHSKGLGES